MLKEEENILKKYGLILFLGTLGTYLVTKIASYFVSFGFDWLKIGTADGWIQFFGTIIGALVTILTVIDAMKKENTRESNALKKDNERERENLAIKNMPYLYLSPVYNYDDPIYRPRVVMFPNKDEDTIPIFFIFNNLTDNPAKLLNLVHKKLYIYSREKEAYEEHDNNKEPMQFQGFIPNIYRDLFVLPGEDEFSKFNFNFMIKDSNHLYVTNEFKLEFLFTYCDIIDLIQYKHTYTYEFKVDKTSNGGFSIHFEHENNNIEKTYIDK